jgi:glucose-1-phosphate thymidylyltransferase
MKTARRVIGLVPAAGRGSRLAPFPCPKELFPVGYQDYDLNGKIIKRPKVVSQYLVEHLVRAGAEEIFTIVGEGKDDILRYYGDGSRFGVRVAYLFQEKLSGMPGALTLAEPWCRDATVLFGMPDTIIEPLDAFVKLREKHDASSADLSIGLFRTDNPSKFGMVDFDTELRVTYTVDKPTASDLEWMWGCACWGPAFTELMDRYLREHPFRQKEIVLGDIFNAAIEQNLNVRAVTFDDGQYIDIGTAEELNFALKRFHL